MIGLASGHTLLGESFAPVSGATLIQHNGQRNCESDDAGNPDTFSHAISNEVSIAPYVEEGFVSSSMALYFWLQATGSFGTVGTVKRHSRLCLPEIPDAQPTDLAEESFLPSIGAGIAILRVSDAIGSFGD
jgi:hypothetical protein